MVDILQVTQPEADSQHRKLQPKLLKFGIAVIAEKIHLIIVNTCQPLQDAVLPVQHIHYVYICINLNIHIQRYICIDICIYSVFGFHSVNIGVYIIVQFSLSL